MDFIVRRAEIRDIPDLLRMNDAFNGAGSTAETMRDSLEKNGSELVFVAIHHDVAVGFACGQVYRSICYADGLQGELTELYVSESYRRSGMGKQLIRQMELAFVDQNVHEVILKTGKENTAAQKFYESCGYSDDQEVVYSKKL